MREENPYESPAIDDRPSDDEDQSLPSPYRSAILSGLMVQAVLGLFALLILDGGSLFRSFAIAAVGHCVVYLLIRGCRPTNPTALDLELIRFGVLPLIVFVEFARVLWDVYAG